jgi:ribonuclease PH
MGKKQRAGWLLIAMAAGISVGIVTTEVVDLVGTQNPEVSETLPVIGFEPVPED